MIAPFSLSLPRLRRRLRVGVAMLMDMVVVIVVVVVMMRTAMIVRVIVVVMMDSLERTAALRVFAENQRLDGDRHRIRRHADTPEVDVIEIPQHHPVDGEDLAFNEQFLSQNRAERLRDVAV